MMNSPMKSTFAHEPQVPSTHFGGGGGGGGGGMQVSQPAQSWKPQVKLLHHIAQYSPSADAMHGPHEVHESKPHV